MSRIKTVDRIDGKELRWIGNGGIIHAVEAVELTPQIVLAWPKCGAGIMPFGGYRFSSRGVTCPACNPVFGDIIEWPIDGGPDY